MAVFVFIVSASLLAYAYFLYPLALMLRFGSADPDPEQNADAFADGWPALSVIVSAHNEASVIARKIENFLADDYPGPRELIVVSDGSSDRTPKIAREFASDKVRVIEIPSRGGKGAAINLAARAAAGEVLVFTDANAYFQPGATRALVRPFAHRQVGLVTGSTVYEGHEIGSLYQRYERFLKQRESRLGVVAGADGAIYAMRRALWRERDPRLINDFTDPVAVSLAGSRSTLAPAALCVEEFRLDGEFARQVRMVSQASMVLFRFLPMLIQKRRWPSIVVLVSHKLLRWMTLPLLVAATLATAVLSRAHPMFAALLVAEVLFVGAVIAGAARRESKPGRLMRFAYEFIALNLAAAIGLWRSVSGNVPVIWQPRSD